MFKFKMLTKVLVAVFFYGLIIELNLNLCIALSIDLSGPAHKVEPDKAGPGALAEHKAELETRATTEDQTDTDRAGLASRVLTSASDTITTTILTTDNSRPAGPSQPAAATPSAEEQLASRSRTLSRRTAPIQRLESNGRANYIGRVLVGEQRLPFMILFDLTSFNFWLPSSECSMSLCLGRLKYDRNASATYRPDEAGRRLEVAYDRGLVLSGPVSRDTVVFADVAIEGQAFGEVTSLECALLESMPVDGFMGLGFRELRRGVANDSGEPPLSPVERLWAMGLLKEPIFSLKIKADVEQYMYSSDNGELILGELSAEYQQSELTYVPVTHVDYWEFHISGVRLRSPFNTHEMEHACDSSCPAVLDTRYAFIGGHFSDVDRINRALGAFPVGNGAYRMSQCDLRLLPYLEFQIGGKEFLMAPEEYVDVRRIRGHIHSCYSILVVVEASQYPFWILGEFFLKRHYIVFDYGQKRIGFARSKTMTHELVEDKYGRISKARKPAVVQV